MKNYSIWKDTFKERRFSSLNKNMNVDVLIIGGGITGASTLYHLKNSGLKVMLVEQNKIGHSVTGNSTGKLTYLQNDLIDKIRKNFNDEVSINYINSQKEGIYIINNIVKKEKISCDLVKVPSYVYTNKSEEVDKLKDLEKFLDGNNIDIVNDKLELVKSKYMFGVSDTYIFHPLKFIYGLLDDNDEFVYEDTSIQKIEKKDEIYICYTNNYKIKAKYVVIASHYPYFNLPMLFPIKGSLEKSYLSASKYKKSKISLISYSNPFISIRSYRDYLIYLSNSHDVNSDVDDKKHFDELLKKINDLDIKPEYLWSNIDIITNDGLPYVGEIDKNVLIGTGYNTWGLANGVLAGKILSDIIMGNSNKYITLFNPKRINLTQITESMIDGVKSMEGYINGYLDTDKEVEYREINGEKVAIYNDNSGEHIVYQKCPHFGCNLILNKVEKTWGCPCHGSRFDIDGKCISGPANKNITFNSKE